MQVRSLLLALVAALVILAASVSSAGSLTSRFWPTDPTADDLADLSDGYEVVEVGAEECGQGGSYQCVWQFVIAHQGSRAELESELQRVIDLNLDGRLQVDEVEPGQLQVRISWGARDPTGWEVIGLLALGSVALVAAASSLMLLLAIPTALVLRRREIV